MSCRPPRYLKCQMANDTPYSVKQESLCVHPRFVILICRQSLTPRRRNQYQNNAMLCHKSIPIPAFCCPPNLHVFVKKRSRKEKKKSSSIENPNPKTISNCLHAPTFRVPPLHQQTKCFVLQDNQLPVLHVRGSPPRTLRVYQTGFELQQDPSPKQS